jgi:hypothetical protein
VTDASSVTTVSPTSHDTVTAFIHPFVSSSTMTALTRNLPPFVRDLGVSIVGEVRLDSSSEEEALKACVCRSATRHSSITCNWAMSSVSSTLCLRD